MAGWRRGLASRTTRLPHMNRILGFQLEGLPEALQFENQRGTLRPDTVAGLPDPAPRRPIIMLPVVLLPHG